jgi:GAF domain-containing protein
MASSLSATSECNAELAALVRHIAEHFGAHVATLYRYDPDHDVFFSPVGVGLRDPGTFEQGKPRSDRIAGKVVKRRKPIIAEDARGHEDMRGPFTHRERIASAAGFPLMFQDRPVGVFFLSYRSPHTFTTEEVAEIEASLVEVTVAMGNMAAEFPAGEAISVAERQLRLILESACTSTGASFGLFRLDRDAARLVIRSATGLRQAFIRSAAVALNTDNVFARAFHTDTPVFVEDLADAGSFPFPEERDFEEWHSLLVAPVRVSGRPAAVLAAFSSASGGFKPSERRLVTEMAMQMGSVLTGERQNRVVSDLQEISTALVAKGLALRDVLELIAQRAQYTFDAPIVTLYPYDEEYHEFDVPIALGIKRPFWAHPTPSEDGLAAQIARTKREWICPDVEEDPGVAGRRFIVVHEVRSSAGFPLRIADEVVAVMFVNYRAPYAFTSDDRSLMALFGSHAALAIKQARLLQAEQRRATMAEIARTFTDSFNRERVLQAVVDGAVTLTDANSCSLWLDDPKSGGFALEARSPALRNPGQDTPRHERGLSRQIVDTGTPVLIPDALSDTRVRQSVKDEGTRSILGVPVRIWGRPVGALYLNSPRENHFRKRDVGLLTSLADYGAIALERMPRRLSEAAENVNKATGEILWLDERIEALLNEIVNGLGFEFAAVQLINAERQEIETVSGFNTPWSGEARHRLDSRDIQADVLRSGETLIIAGWDDRFDRKIYDAYGHSDLVRVFTPLRADGHFVGTVEAGYHMSAHPDITLEERDALCQAVARHAETIHCATLQHVLGVIIDNAVRMVRADSGSIHLRYDEDRGRFDYEALAGARIDQAFLDAFPPRSSTGLGWRVLQDGKPAWEDDPQQLAAANPGIYAPQALWAKDPIRYPQGQGVRAIACLPLALPDSPYKGLFYVHFWSPHKFGQDEIEALELLARQVSVGIQNAQVFGEQRDLARALASMSTVGRSLAKKVELGSLLYEIAEKASTVLRADLVNIYEYHEKDEYFDTPPKVFGELRFPTPMHSAVFPGDAPRELLAARHNIFATDAAKNLVLCRRTSRPDAAAKDPFIVREGIQSAAGVLLRAQDEVVGVMFVNYRCQRNFSYTDRSAIESFATYAALAVQTARNLTQTQVDTFGHLRRVSTAIMSFAELRAVLNQIAASSCSLLGATDAVILPRDPVTGRWLTEQAAHSGQGDAPFPLGEPRPEGWTEMVRHQGLVVVPDVAKAVRTAGIPGGRRHGKPQGQGLHGRGTLIRRRGPGTSGGPLCRLRFPAHVHARATETDPGVRGSGSHRDSDCAIGGRSAAAAR